MALLSGVLSSNTLCNDSLRKYVAHHRSSLVTPPIQTEQLTASVSFTHSKHNLHGDISRNHVFLDEALDLTLGDFAGSSPNAEQPLISIKVRYSLSTLHHMKLRNQHRIKDSLIKLSRMHAERTGFLNLAVSLPSAISFPALGIENTVPAMQSSKTSELKV